jgi:hypothetical protein
VPVWRPHGWGQYTIFPNEPKLKNRIVGQKNGRDCAGAKAPVCPDICVFIGPSHKKIKFFLFFCRKT